MKTKLSLVLASLAMAFSVGAGAASTNKKVEQAEAATYSQTVDQYYSTSQQSGDAAIDWNQTGATLKTSLFKKIKITTAGWSYDGLWEAYKKTDVRPDGTHFWDIYSDSTDYTLNDNRINASYKKEGDSINREHVIPQSTFNEAAPMKSDIHHVLPSDGYVNNRRSAYPHGIVTGSPTYTSNDGCKLGSGTGSTTVFEPMDNYKGDIARIYFYFVTCYQDKMSSNSFSAFDKSTHPSIKTAYLNVYLQWAKDDPVSQKEIDRNNAAYAGQGNRNPFIDCPYAVGAIWDSTHATDYGNKGEYTSGTGVSISKTSASMISGGTTTISATSTEGGTINWTTSNSSVVSLSSSTSSSGTNITLTAESAGSATITASQTISGTTYSKTCSVTVSATKQVTSIAISGQKTSYSVDDTFVKPTVTATYNDGTQATVTSDATCSGYNMSSAGNYTVTVSYSYGGATKTTTYEITVSSSGGGSGDGETVLKLDTSQNSGSSGTTVYTSVATSTTYSNYTDTTNKWAVTLGSQQSSALWLGSNNNQKSKMTLGNGSVTGASAIAAAISVTTSSTYYAALFQTTSASPILNVSSVEVTFDSTAGTFPSEAWIVYSTNSGTSWNVFEKKTTLDSKGTTFTHTAIPSAIYGFVIHSTGYCQFKKPVLDFKAVNKTLSEIDVLTFPTKMNYEFGEYFDPTGLVITRKYSDSSTDTYAYEGHTSEFTFDPSTSTPLASGMETVEVTYGGESCFFEIELTAAKELSSISISGYTTAFVEGDTFAFGGTVTAHYADASTEDVTNSSTFSGYNMTTIGNQTVTVTYQSQTATYQITVSAGTLNSIAVSGQTTTYTKNAAFSFDGTCTATFANGYQKEVTPTNVTSPDMSTTGNKTITVSYTYNGNTRTTTYQITVNSYRTVMEESYSVIGTITYTNDTEEISVATLSTTSSGGYSAIDKQYHAWRLGAGSKTGTLTVTSTTANIRKIVVNAKYYSSDSGTTFTIDGTSKTLTNSYANYEKEFSTAKSSVALSSVTNGKRVLIASVTVYSCSSQDIGQSEDCIGLETFITNYMHMDYTENLGYCSDTEHHYYSTAKTAFNALNSHQRSLFTGNSAYTTEWTRLSTWASKNGDSLNNSNQLAAGANPNPMSIIVGNSGNIVAIITVVALISTVSIGGYFFLKKRKEF